MTRKQSVSTKGNRSEYNKMYSRTPNGRFRLFLAQAKARGFAVELNFVDFTKIISEPCIYCRDRNLIGIDRVDNSLGYLLANCAPCCKVCNFMKKDMSQNDFLNQVSKISKSLLIE